jgi:5'-nucleotidase
VTGKALHEALENSVCLYPALEGRFPQVSGISFAFDPTKPANSRVDPSTVIVAGAALDLERKYTLSTRGYMARGKDGYTSLLVQSEGGEAEEIVNEENGMLISTIIRQYFMSLKVLGKWKMWGASMERHWKHVHKGLQQHSPEIKVTKASNLLSQAVTTLKKSSVPGQNERSPDSTGDDEPSSYDSDYAMDFDISDRRLATVRKVVKKWRRLAGLKNDTAVCDAMGEGEFKISWTKAIAPRLEGRIRIVGKD